MHWYRLLQRRLLIRVTLPTLLACVQLVLAIIDLARGKAPAAALAWLFPGLLLGYPFGRLTHVSWNTEKSQLALLGGQSLLTVIYLLVVLGAHFVLKHELSQVRPVSTIVLLVAAGIALGRLVGLSHQILHALSDRGTESSIPGGSPR